jgi:Fe-S oxidoreductase
MEVGAEVLVTSCPYCISNFEASRETLGVVENIAVKDVTEVVAEAL